MPTTTFKLHASRLASVFSLITLCTLFPANAAENLVRLDEKADASAVQRTATNVFKISAPEALKSMKRVGIHSFQIEFVLRSSATAQARGSVKEGDANASLYYNLTGPTPADFQSITDKLYAEFVDSLKAQGLEVLTPAQMAASPTYQKFTTEAAKSPIKSGDTETYSATGVPAIRLTGEMATGAGVFGSIAAMVGGISVFDMLKVPAELDANTLDVRFALNYVNLSTNTSGFFGRFAKEAEVTGSIQPTLVSGQTAVHIRNAKTSTVMTLETPLRLYGTAIRDVKETTSTATKVGLVTLNVVAGLAGIKSSATAEEMSAIADPTEYRNVVGANLSQVKDMMIGRMLSER